MQTKAEFQQVHKTAFNKANEKIDQLQDEVLNLWGTVEAQT